MRAECSSNAYSSRSLLVCSHGEELMTLLYGYLDISPEKERLKRIAFIYSINPSKGSFICENMGLRMKDLTDNAPTDAQNITNSVNDYADADVDALLNDYP